MRGEFTYGSTYFLRNVSQPTTPLRSESSYVAHFEFVLSSSIGFAMFELAIELLSTPSLIQACALVAAVAAWTALAICAATLLPHSSRQFHILCLAGLVTSLLMFFAGTTTSTFGLCLYAIDCLGKCAVVMLALPIQAHEHHVANPYDDDPAVWRSLHSRRANLIDMGISAS